MPQERAAAEREDQRGNGVLSSASLAQLYLAERERRQAIRSRLSIPVSVVSFSIFGLVAFTPYFDISEWREPVTLAMTVLLIVSLGCLLAALVCLSRVELHFMRVEMDDLEDLHQAETERAYFDGAYFEARRQNAAGARLRAQSFLLMLAALAFFIAAVALLPFHLADTNVHGRSGSETAAEN